jgi:hypothetical protein
MPQLTLLTALCGCQLLSPSVLGPCIQTAVHPCAVGSRCIGHSLPCQVGEINYQALLSHLLINFPSHLDCCQGSSHVPKSPRPAPGKKVAELFLIWSPGKASRGPCGLQQWSHIFSGVKGLKPHLLPYHDN